MNTNAPSYIPSYAKEEGGDDFYEKYQRLNIIKTKSSRIDRSNEFGRLGVLNGMN
jgi:hypothetical protein